MESSPTTANADARKPGATAGRPPRAAFGARANPAKGWQVARVIGVIPEAPGALTLRLHLDSPAGFLPGQYYNVRVDSPGRPRGVQRAYSVASSPFPDPSVIDIGVKEIGGGLVSPRLVRGVAPGDHLEVRGPAGRFHWSESDGGPLLLVGAGSGVVPLMSIIRYGVERHLALPMTLLCSAADFDHAFYHDELGGLAGTQQWLRLVHTFTRDPTDPRADYHRRIDRDMVAGVLGDGLPALAYLCGPPAMVEGVAAWLADLGLDAGRIRTEKYD